MIGRRAVGVGAVEADDVSAGQHLVPAGQGVAGSVQALQERPAPVQGVRGGGQEGPDAGLAPLGVAVDDLDPPGAGKVPARPAEIGASREGVRGEGEAPEVPDVLEVLEPAAGEAVGGVLGQAQGEEVALDRGDLGAHQDQDAVVAPFQGLGVDVVVVGDPDEVQARRARGGDHLLRRASAVGEGRVHVDDTHGAGVAVPGRLADEGQRLPEGHARGPGPAQDEGGQEEKTSEPPSLQGHGGIRA